MLNGRKALIMEMEFLIALDQQRILEEFQVGETLFAHTAAEAEQLYRRWPDIALALIEIRQNDAPTEALLVELLDARIPIVLITADAALLRGCPRFPQLPVLIKPVPEPELMTAIAGMLASSAEASP